MKNDAHPFQKIGICLSGGGYRATSYSLGVLSYLNRSTFNDQPLIKNVKAISTVSGGTIAGMGYALSTTQGKTFETFFKELLTWMQETDLIKESFDLLKEPDTWKYSHKNKNLINAFAELYDKHLTKGATFSEFEKLNEHSHLEMVCFNATEFSNGTAFRFQKSAVASGLAFGNSRELRLKRDIHNHICLSDVIAASSCFPGGFEPLEMPKDFFAPDSEAGETFGTTKTPFAVMDGGIVDNQGLSSLLNYGKDKGFDLFIATDVSSPHMDKYVPAAVNTEGNRKLTLRDIQQKAVGYLKFMRYTAGASTVLALLLQFFAVPVLLKGIALGVGLVALILFIGTFWISDFVSKKISGGLLNFVAGKIPSYLLTRLKTLPWADIPFYQFEQLATNRARSLGLLVGDIFMKQIRRLHYSDAYEKVSRREINLIECMVKELTDVDFTSYKADYAFMAEQHYSDFEGESYKDIIGKKMLEITTYAAEMGTTLWFTDDNKSLSNLIISGQFTCCHNLLIYTTRLLQNKQRSYSPEVTLELQNFQERLYHDWKMMRAKPDIFLSE
jgi:predicted acylesterase/phospholipase RssA